MTNKIIFKKTSSYQELSKLVAQEFIKIIKAKPSAILGLATGSSPIGVYQELIKAYKNKEISFKDCSSFNLDEYLGLKREYEDQSYRFFMNSNLFNHVDINKSNTFFPIDPFSSKLSDNYEAYDKKIDDKNGIDILILGIGNNGHIGFNEPNSELNSKTRVVDLTQSTIKANSRFFKSEEDVPKQAVTMGLSTILKAKKIVLVVVGESKKEALESLKTSSSFNPKWPCTALVNHHDVTVYYIQ